MTATTPIRPTTVELRAAVEVFLRAWTARPAYDLLPLADDDDWIDDTNGCGCGGETDEGDPICNCGGGCGCRTCSHYEHARARTCGVRECGAATRFRVRGFCVHRDGVTRSASDDDPQADNGMVKLGDSVQRHPNRFACSTQHARELIASDRAYREAFPADSALHNERTFYEVEAYRYEPDDIDVPGSLHSLQEALKSAAWSTRRAISTTFGSQPGHPEDDVIGVQRNVAFAAYHLLRYAEEQDQAAKLAGEEV